LTYNEGRPPYDAREPVIRHAAGHDGRKRRMTTAATGPDLAAPPARSRFAAAWAATRGAERAGYLIGAVLLLAGAFHLGVFAVRGGPWTGPVSWRKPITFGLSFGLTLITVTWVTSYLRVAARTRAVLLGIFAADCVAEVGGITLQAWRRVPSHFNLTSAANRSVSMSLAVGGGILIVVLVAFAVPALRGNPDLPPSMRLALRAGFVTMFVGLASGAAMIARGVTLVDTGHQQLAYQLGGFLKPVHAVSLHGILVLPAVAWLLGRTGSTERRRVRAVSVAVAGYAVAIAAALIVSLANAGG
jgi:hypothetical protein